MNFRIGNFKTMVSGIVKPTAQEPNQPSVIIETLGREHSGKTGSKAMLYKLTQAGPMPSGLELTTADPREQIRFMNQAIRTYQGLQNSGFTSTLEPDLLEYGLFHADEQRALFQLRESIGQLLTFDTPEGDENLNEMFNSHQANMAKCDVLHVFISCPADDSPVNLERLQNDLTVLAPNLRLVLRSRAPQRKLAVALVIAKADGAFTTAEEAKKALTDERLRALLFRLVHLLESSDRVGMAAIIPISAFGFGKARKLEPKAGNNHGQIEKGFSLLSQGEEEWILKPGEMPQPFNLTSLAWWSLMAGIALKPADQNGSMMAETVKMLCDDLKKLPSWLVPLNCKSTQ